MADYLLIGASSHQEYPVRVAVEEYEVTAIVDTGFTHSGCQVGLALKEADYHVIRDRLQALEDIEVRAVGQDPRFVESGTGRVRIAGLDSSEIETRIINAGENLLGVCYFHNLSGYTVDWDLQSREIRIRRA